MAPHLNPSRENWLVRKSGMAAAIAAYPWEETPLGELASWPPHLRMTVNLILEAGASMSLVWGRDFRFIYNDRYAQTIQDKHPAALGRAGAEVFPESWPTLLPLFERALGGEAISIEDFEVPLNRSGATTVGYFSFSYNPIRSDDGHVDGFLAVVVETTARVVRERNRAQMFDTVLSSITDFAYTFDRDGRFIFVNKALLDLWGLQLDDAVGKNFFDLKYPDDLAARLQRQIQQVIDERTTVRDETRYVSPTGVDAYYEYIFSPVFAPDGSVRVVAGSTRDITSRKKLETDALAASKAKDHFLATLSHELRTPLNPVLLLATEAAENPELPERVRDDFKTIVENVRLEARLIDDLLDISRITHDKLPLNLQPLDLHPLVLRAVESVQSELREKKLSVVQRLEAPSALVFGDEIRVQQIFWNLLRNSAKFTPPRGCITVLTRVHATNPGTVVVEITDTGIGMTADELAKVFNPFAQGEHTTDGTARFGGLGLGLAISQKIAGLHAGTISAQSPGRGRGATFTVELPLHLPAASSSAAEERSVPRSASMRSTTTGAARVLLVEDHEPSRIALARLLVHRKIEVIESGSAREALSKAKEQHFDLVISDIGLPDISGYDLMATLKETYGVRGIALSGYGSQDDIARGRDAGFLTHLTKPVQARALDEALRQFLRD